MEEERTHTLPIFSFKGKNKVMNALMEDLNIDASVADQIISYVVVEFAKYDKKKVEWKEKGLKSYKVKMRIWTKLFQRLFKNLSINRTKQDGYKIIIESLKRSGFITQLSNHSTRYHISRLYRMEPRTFKIVGEADNFVHRNYKYELLNGSMKKDLQRTAYMMDSIYDALKRIKIDIDTEGIEKEDKEIIDSVNNNKGIDQMTTYRGRVYDVLKNIKSEYRQNITIDGERTEEVDIKTSQPKFLAKILEDEIDENERDNNTKWFINICLRGDIYEHMWDIFSEIVIDRGGTRYEYTPMLKDRDEAKQFFYYIFFGYNKNSQYKGLYSNSKLWRWAGARLREIYGQVFAVIDNIKRHDHRTLNQVLTLYESEFAYKVTKWFNEQLNEPVYNVHDSFITFEDRGVIVDEMIYDHFDCYHYIDNPDIVHIKRRMAERKREDINKIKDIQFINELNEEWAKSDQDEMEMIAYGEPFSYGKRWNT